MLQNTEGGDTDSEDEADRLEELESYLKVYDPDFKTLVNNLQYFLYKTYVVVVVVVVVAAAVVSLTVHWRCFFYVFVLYKCTFTYLLTY